MSTHSQHSNKRHHVSMDRREFLKAGIGFGAAALGLGAAADLAACAKTAGSDTTSTDAAIITDDPNAPTLTTIQVSSDQLIVGTNFLQVDLGNYLTQTASYQLPRGCLLYQAAANTALVQVPAGAGSDLISFSLMNLDTGELQSLRSGAVGASTETPLTSAGDTSGTASASSTASGADTAGGTDTAGGNTNPDGSAASNTNPDATAAATTNPSATSNPSATAAAFPDAILYDGRASDSALIWTEFDLSSQGWQVYAASLSGTPPNATLGLPYLLDQGTSDYEVPKICISGAKVYWQVMPNASGPASYQDSYLKAASPGSQDPYIVYTSHGRMITQPLVSDGNLSFVPRVSTKNIYYRLTALAVADDQLVSSQILPQSLKVSDAIYFADNFTFSIESNYTAAGALNQIGTYRQLDDGNWLFFGKPPSAAACQINGLVVLKSSLSVVCLDIPNQSYSSIMPPANCEDYGDTLAGWGSVDRIITYTNTKATTANIKQATIVRIFMAVQPPAPTDTDAATVQTDTATAAGAN